MGDTAPATINLPQLGDEILWRIFTKLDPKNAARCRALNRRWRCRLMIPLFAKHNFRENRSKHINVICGIGNPPVHDNSKSFVRVDVDTKEELNVEFPVEIRGFWNYSMIGSDHGIICLKFERAGLIFGIMLWYPLTRQRHYCNDESRKHLTHAVSALAFGHIFDTLDYAIVHVFKKVFHQDTLSWSLYSKRARNWDCTGVAIPKPKSIITFNLNQRRFHEVDIPNKAKRAYHSLTTFNGGVGFISSQKMGFSYFVEIFQVNRSGSTKFDWQSMVRVNGIGVPFTPIAILGKDILSVLESRSGGYSANDAERTDLLISKHEYQLRRREHLLYRTWNQIFSLKSDSALTQFVYSLNRLHVQSTGVLLLEGIGKSNLIMQMSRF
ncbi:hypothetical protein PIB30_001967 [Stylosanthes scabra]|uniref:F-box domain-containing protein n=1 Tax=Stylosanthes scabra TaxID=79078 RepID=A0ABU6Z2M7_9FABA|nr:hypothetical protein [Stylosanthes scabra]